MRFLYMNGNIHQTEAVYYRVNKHHLVNHIMSKEEHDALLSQMDDRLSALLDLQKSEIELELEPPSLRSEADAILTVMDQVFVAEMKMRGSSGPIAAHIDRLKSATTRVSADAIPIIVTPYMKDSGKEVCAREGVSWFDYSGNAHIIAPRIRILIEGRPNLFIKRGRPASAFAPKSSRISRWLLTHPFEAFAQRDIAQHVGVSEGLVSRVVSRLEADRYLKRNDEGLVLVDKPGLLLDAWREEYRFDRHTILRGHMAARSGDALARQVADLLTEADIQHAATGLAAAWQRSRFAGFRTATFYVDRAAMGVLEKGGFRPDERGANLWLVRPNDQGVYQGADECDGVRCVHTVQTVIDLDSQPERSAEAADNLRTEHIGW